MTWVLLRLQNIGQRTGAAIQVLVGLGLYFDIDVYHPTKGDLNSEGDLRRPINRHAGAGDLKDRHLCLDGNIDGYDFEIDAAFDQHADSESKNHIANDEEHRL